jgi:nitronate monooxygenase
MRKAKEKATGDGNITNEEHRQLSKEGNVFCMIKDIIKTREIIGPQKPLFMNMITDGTDYKDAVAAACANGIDGIVTAGIAFDLPSLTQKYPDIALVPILFDMKFLKKTLSVRRDRYKKTPDAMIIPDVFKTGGHFPENMENEANRLENLMPEIHEYLDHPDNLKTPEEGAFKKIPLIIAGGHFDRKDVDRSLAL